MKTTNIYYKVHFYRPDIYTELTGTGEKFYETSCGKYVADSDKLSDIKKHVTCVNCLRLLTKYHDDKYFLRKT
jgi:hypothetical protein